jgi:hypothetical protein
VHVLKVDVDTVVLKQTLVTRSTSLTLPHDVDDGGAEDDGGGSDDDKDEDNDGGSEVDEESSEDLELVPSVVGEVAGDLVGVPVFGLSSSSFPSSPESSLRWSSNGPMSSAPLLTFPTSVCRSLIAHETRPKREAVHPPELELGGVRCLRKPSAKDIVSLRSPTGGPMLGLPLTWFSKSLTFS